MNSKELRDLRNSIIEKLNTADIPTEVKRMMLLEIMQQVDFTCEKEIQMLREGENSDGN